MLWTAIATVAVAFTFGQASPPRGVGIANATAPNDTWTHANAQVLPSMPSLNLPFSDELVARASGMSESEVFGDSSSLLEDTTISEPPPSTSPLPEADVGFSTEAIAESPAEEKLEEKLTTWRSDEEATMGDEASEATTLMTPVMAAIDLRGTVFNCFCDIDQVLVDGACVPYPSGTKVHMRESRRVGLKVSPAPMAGKRVIIKDLECDTESGSQELTFSKGEFRLRDRGDIVLMAGDLEGLRSGDYCISHFLDDYGDLTWMAKVCVEPPSVPRCCPPGQSMKNNVCHPSRSPEVLRPPISADPYGQAAPWPVIKNFESPLFCSSEPMKDLPLIPGESYLTAHPEGMIHVWVPEVLDYQVQYHSISKYCVDGNQNLDGSTSYSVKVCFESPAERHQRICTGNVCVRKCCQYGEIMDGYLNRCIPSPSTQFTPHMNTEFKVVVGLPLCFPSTPIADFFLSPDTGYLNAWNQTPGIAWNLTSAPSDYCIDTFADREGRHSPGSLVCVDLFTWWEKAKDLVFPICQLISLIFLALILLCYVTVPVLLSNTGKYHLCHVVSLTIAYTAAVAMHFLNRFISKAACVALAIMMQFGYLSAFFWLSVLCFDVWRLFKSLEGKLRPPMPVPSYVYHGFAWGGPTVIGVATLILQYVNTEDYPWITKPHLGESKCWFGPDMEQLLFFYLYIAILLSGNCIFIAHTYWNKRKMDKSLSAVRGDKNGNTSKPVMETSHRNRDVYSEFITKFLLLALISSCWVTEVLSWQIPPPEMWAVTDIINTLQGFFVFVIFLHDRRKRKHLQKKFPKVFGLFKSLFLGLKRVKEALTCSSLSTGTFSPSTYISTLNRKLSSSSLVSNLSTLSSSLKFSSTSTLSFGNKRNATLRSDSFKEDNGIVTLSVTPISQKDSNSSISSASSNSSIC